MKRYFLSIILSLGIVSIFFLSPYCVFAAKEDCKVGDITTGYWKTLPVPQECPFTASHASDSPWPNPTDGLIGSAHAVSGRYRIFEFMSVSENSWSATIPRVCDSSLWNGRAISCISEYVETYASTHATLCNQPDSSMISSSCSANGNLMRWDTINNGEITSTQYLRYCAVNNGYQEWVCFADEPPCTTCNQGPALCPIDQNMMGGA